MTIVSYANLIYKVARIPRMTCLTCGDIMPLILIDPLPIAPSFDIRTFHCKACDVQESFMIDISPTDHTQR